MNVSFRDQLGSVRKALFGSSRPKRERRAVIINLAKREVAPQVSHLRYAGVSVSLPW